MIEFNINEYVMVKLTDHGRSVLREQAEAFRREFPSVKTGYTPPKEDADGWSKWQLWTLIEAFGSEVHMGCKVPFETTIRIVEKADQPVFCEYRPLNVAP